MNWFFSITDSMTLLVIASSGWHLALYIVICYRNQGQNRKQEKLKITTQYISRFLTFLSRNVVVAINCCLLSSCSKIARRFLNNICNCHQNMLLGSQKYCPEYRKIIANFFFNRDLTEEKSFQYQNDIDAL